MLKKKNKKKEGGALKQRLSFTVTSFCLAEVFRFFKVQEIKVVELN